MILSSMRKKIMYVYTCYVYDWCSPIFECIHIPMFRVYVRIEYVSFWLICLLGPFHSYCSTSILKFTRFSNFPMVKKFIKTKIDRFVIGILSFFRTWFERFRYCSRITCFNVLFWYFKPFVPCLILAGKLKVTYVVGVASFLHSDPWPCSGQRSFPKKNWFNSNFL